MTVQEAINALSVENRNTQASAVDELAGYGGACLQALEQAWERTNRPDVCCRILEVLARLGKDGALLLLRLKPNPNYSNDLHTHREILEAIVAHDLSILEDIESEINHTGNSFVVHILKQLLDRFSIDPKPYARRLLGSGHASVRASALYSLIDAISINEKLDVLFTSADDADSRVRGAAAQQFAKAAFVRACRKSGRSNYHRLLAQLIQFLDSEDEEIAQGAAQALAATKEVDDAVLRGLERVFNSESRSYRARTEAMNTYISVHPNRSKAVTQVLERIEQAPLHVCTALSETDTIELPESAIRRIVTVLPRARSREMYPAAELLKRVGTRAIGPLIDGLLASDDDISAYSAEVLAGFGLDAEPAIPTIVDQLRIRGRSWRGLNYVNALLGINPDLPEVRQTLRDLILGNAGDPYVAGNALGNLIQTRASEEWVKAIARPVLNDPGHALYAIASHYSRRDMADVLAENERSLADQLSDTSARDIAWAKAIGGGDRVNDPGALTIERDRRMRAARAIQVLNDPEPETIEKLIASLKNGILECPDPLEPEHEEHLEAQFRAMHYVWAQERHISVTLGCALATHMDRCPKILAHVIEELSEHPFALATVLSSPVLASNEYKESVLEVPGRLADKAVLALSKHAVTATPHQSQQRWIINALSRLRTQHPLKLSTLKQLILFGEGLNGPPAALAGIGHSRPVSDEVLELIRSHLDDLRPRMRIAAVVAAKNAEQHAKSLANDLIKRGRAKPRGHFSECVARALQCIAPDSPEILDYLEAFGYGRSDLSTG